ncbi:MFS transporter [Allokutzneria oryzae]|uniref:MFS transporter n=1 Tax=Allokutzneria oryzae TaxID=1378989 RepID=A0ABV5ZRH1_9PSEU
MTLAEPAPPPRATVGALPAPTPSRTRGPLAAVLVANAVSGCGTTMTLMAIPWFVLQTTGSATQTGLVGAIEAVGLVLSSVLGGPLVGRFGAKAVSVLSDLVAVVAVGLIPLLHATNGLPFWQLVVLAMVIGMSRAPGDTARYSMLPRLTELAGTTVERAASGYDGAGRATRMLGGPLAGSLIALTGPPQVLVIDAATFLFSALVVAVWVRHLDGAPAERRNYLAELREGISYLRSDRLIAAIAGMIAVTNALDSATITVLMPSYARDVLHSSVALGMIIGVFGACALTGTLIYGWIGHRIHHRRLLFTTAFILVGPVRLLIYTVDPGLPAILLVVAVAGFAAGSINPLLAVVEYGRIPVRIRSTVIGAIGACALVGMPLGSLLGGLAVETWDVHLTFAVGGLIYLGATLCPLVFPVWREMDSR